MKLSLETDYAIRAAISLAMNNGRVQLTKLGCDMALYNFQMRAVIPALSQAGIAVETEDGLALVRGKGSLTVFDIVKAVEGDIAINRCLAPDNFCSMVATETCPVRVFYQDLQELIVDKLKSKRIVEFVE